MAADTSVPDRRYRSIVVIGGGCYGSYYVRQLSRAARVGAFVGNEVLVVDRDADCAVARALTENGKADPLAVRVVTSPWDDFLDGWLEACIADPIAAAGDAIVPSPLMPHLLFQWLERRARRRWPKRHVSVEPLDRPPAVPWERASPNGTHYVSFAEWTCPVNCIEPARCPKTRDARSWSMPDALREWADVERRAGRTVAGPFVFHCTHRVYGVGMIDVADVLTADAELARLGAAGALDALVGTVSHCHGALNRLVVGA